MRRALLLLLALSACRAPKYARYASEDGDFSLEAPYGWRVFVEKGACTFVGPFDPDFYRGRPSLSVRWHGGASAEEFAARLAREVYGLEAPARRRVEVSGWQAWNFELASEARAPSGEVYGVSERGGESFNDRRHAYVLVPMDRGFYEIVYPATRAGYEKHLARFNRLVNTFEVLKEGPQGPRI